MVVMVDSKRQRVAIMDRVNSSSSKRRSCGILWGGRNVNYLEILCEIVFPFSFPLDLWRCLMIRISHKDTVSVWCEGERERMSLFLVIFFLTWFFCSFLGLNLYFNLIVIYRSSLLFEWLVFDWQSCCFLRFPILIIFSAFGWIDLKNSCDLSLLVSFMLLLSLFYILSWRGVESLC